MIHLLLPAYNESDGIIELLDEIDAVRKRLDVPVRVIVIDDGSTDGTGDAVSRVAESDKVVLLRHDLNRGLRHALETGLTYALEQGGDGDLIGAMDADLTHDPVYLADMLARVQSGADVVVASRYAEGGKEVGVSLWRHILSEGASVTYRLLAPWVHVRDVSCGYRLVRWELVRKGRDHWGDALLEAQGFACTGELLVKLALLTAPEKMAEIPFTLRYDAKRGPSKMPTFRTIVGTLCMLLKARRHKKRP